MTASRWLFSHLFRWLKALDDLRSQEARAYVVGEGLAVLVVGAIFWRYLNGIFALPPEHPEWSEAGWTLSHIAASGLVGFLVAVFFRAFLPFLYYAPHALGMRTMGLVSASTAPGAVQDELRKYVSLQETDARIRIICISGRYLFRESRILGDTAPLEKAADSGLIDALVPRPEANNPTVVERFETYSERSRRKLYPNGIGDLIAEVAQGQAVLENAHRANSIVQHDALCMWRVILLRTHCIVQNYFPNTTGDESDNAPVFVFQNLGEKSYSYYRCFELMFDILRRRSRLSTSSQPVKNSP